MDFLPGTCGRRRSLLLIYLFVLEAAANCPKPEGKDNVVLTTDSNLMNEFPEGSVVTLECAHGHLIEGGSDKMTCTGGQWTEPELICKKKDCGQPKPQPHMAFVFEGGTLFGAFMNVHCDKGYEISGMSYRQCLGDRWGGFSKCEIITCEPPPVIANGMTLWDSSNDPEYEQVIEFACEDGYTLIGHQRIVCSETGEYDHGPPTCKAVSTSTERSATSTAQEDKNITTSATPSVSSSAGGGRDTSTAEEGTTTASVNTTTSLRDDHGEVIKTQASTGYALPLIITVLCTLLITAVVICICKFLLRRKGSYDTREDQKPELLQSQNL